MSTEPPHQQQQARPLASSSLMIQSQQLNEWRKNDFILRFWNEKAPHFTDWLQIKLVVPTRLFETPLEH